MLFFCYFFLLPILIHVSWSKFSWYILVELHFFANCFLYDPHRRWDFGEFFVVKESLALMFKELQLPAEALLKYQVRFRGYRAGC